MRPTERGFYERPVVVVARELIGCVVEHAGCSGVIVETEAYHESESACHAYAGLTARTGTLFGEPGRAYVYRSYGIHALLNAVTEPVGVGSAVLIRALEPLEGIEEMRRRRRLESLRSLCSGPGKLTQALGIELGLNGSDLLGGPISIGPALGGMGAIAIAVDTRVGITKAAELPWRFCAAGNRFLSRPVQVGRGRTSVPAAAKAGSTGTAAP